MTALCLAAVVNVKPEATPEDIARIRYAVSLMESAAHRLVAEYDLPATVAVVDLDAS